MDPSLGLGEDLAGAKNFCDHALQLSEKTGKRPISCISDIPVTSLAHKLILNSPQSAFPVNLKFHHLGKRESL